MPETVDIPKHICLLIFKSTELQHQVVDAVNGNKAMVSFKECVTDKFLTRVNKVVVPLQRDEALTDDQSFGVVAGPDPGTVSFIKQFPKPVHWICERSNNLEMCEDPTSFFRPELLAER